jgi:hypothetical protein
MPAVMATQMLTKNNVMATTVVLVARFIVPPVLSRCYWLPIQDTAHGAFELDTQQFELTRGNPEPLRVAHHPPAVEKHQEAVLAIQHGIDLFIHTLYIGAERVSKRHGSELRGRHLRRIRRIHE